MNATIKAKREELEGVRIAYDKILAEHKTFLPAEEQVRLNVLREKATEIRAAIDAETKMAEARADAADLTRYLDNPVQRIPHGANGDDSEMKQFNAAGWEIKGDFVYKMTSLNQSVPMFPRSSLFGEVHEDIRRDPIANEHVRLIRATMGENYKTAYTNLIRMTAKYGPAALTMLSGAEQKALSEGTDTAGGFAVPPDIQAEVLVRIPQWAVMRGKARVQPTNRETLRFPAVAANTGTYSGISGGSILSSGFVGSWAGETPAFSDTDLSWQAFDIAVKKIRCATRISNDFAMDAAVNVLAFLAQDGAQNMALVEDLGFIQGLGAALQPLGLLNVPGISTTSVAGTTSHVISNTTASPTSSTSGIITLAYSLPAQYTRNATWVMRRTIEGEIRGLVDANGRYMWPAYADSGLVNGSPSNLLGFPVLHSDWMPADGTSGNAPLILGDLQHYIIAQRTQITSVVLRERFMDTDQVGIILFERVGGGAYNSDAFRIGTV